MSLKKTINSIKHDTRRLRKKLSKPAVKLLAACLAWSYRGYMALVWHSSRVESYGMGRAVNAVRTHDNLLVALWHDNVVLAPRCGRDFRPTTLASHSDSGELISAILRLQKYHVFRGGSSRGKSRRTPVLQQLVDYVKKRREVLVALTVDGSTGPARVLKPGIIALSRDTGAPIFAIHIACKPVIHAPSWDRTRIPLPFGRIVLVFEGPIRCDLKPIDAEEFRRLRDKTQLLLDDTARRAEQYIARKQLIPPDPRLELDPSYGDRDLRTGRDFLRSDERPINPRLRQTPGDENP